jgi:DNA-binding MarR family transcriptional regulator
MFVGMMTIDDLPVTDYRALAELRYRIRCFLHFSEQQAREAGIEPQHHQLLLAIKGLPEGVEPTIGELAERLQLQHHSTVELVNRLEGRDLVLRERGSADKRQVLVRLTDTGERVLRDLSLAHRRQLRTAVPDLLRALQALTEREALATQGAPRNDNH